MKLTTKAPDLELPTWPGVVGRAKPTTLAQQIALAKAAGYTGGLPILCAGGHLNTDSDDKTIGEAARLMAENGFYPRVLVAPIWYLNWHESKANVEKFLQAVKDTIALAAKLAKLGLAPVKVIRIDSGLDANFKLGAGYYNGFRRFAKLIRDCAQLCQDAGILLVVEGEPCWMFLNQADEILRLFDAADHLNAKYQFDFSHNFFIGREVNVAERRRTGTMRTVIEMADALKPIIGDWHLAQTCGELRSGGEHPPTGQHSWLFAEGGKIPLVETLAWIFENFEVPAMSFDACLLPEEEAYDAALHAENRELAVKLIGQALAQ